MEPVEVSLPSDEDGLRDISPEVFWATGIEEESENTRGRKYSIRPGNAAECLRKWKKAVEDGHLVPFSKCGCVAGNGWMDRRTPEKTSIIIAISLIGSTSECRGTALQARNSRSNFTINV